MFPEVPRFLIIQTASIGDVVLATAILESLHESYPDSRIDFLAKNGMQALFRDHPHIDQLLIWDKQHGKYSGLIKILGQVRRNHYDLVVNIQRFASSGLITALSGARYKSGFRKNPFSRLFTHRAAHTIGDGTHETERNFSLIRWIPGVQLHPPKLYPGEPEEKKIKTFITEPFITVAPASLWYTKQYPVDKWVEFLDHLPGTYKVYLMGGPDDRSICERISKTSTNERVTDLSGKLDLLESAALMKHARMNFVNDSAPMHLASAVNAPVRAVFCSTIPEFGFGPLSEDSGVIQTRVDLGCRPCGLHGWDKCPEGHFDCARTIDTTQLLREV